MKVNNRRHAKMSRKASAVLALCVVLVLTIAVGYLGVHGTWLDSRGLYKLLPWLPTTDVDNWPQSIALGLDLKGGVYVEYEATMSDELREEGNNFDYLLQNTMDIIAKRLTEKGYPEATVSKVGVSGIRVEIPGAGRDRDRRVGRAGSDRLSRQAGVPGLRRQRLHGRQRPADRLRHQG